MNVTIREIRKDDYGEILELIKKFAELERSVDKMINSEKKMINEQDYINGFVALSEENIIVGYATYFFTYFTWVGKSLYMDDLYVKDGCRSHGIGHQLIERVIELAKLEECNRLRWQVSHWNKDAQKFYNKLGAKISSEQYNCDLILND